MKYPRILFWCVGILMSFAMSTRTTAKDFVHSFGQNAHSLTMRATLTTDSVVGHVDSLTVDPDTTKHVLLAGDSSIKKAPRHITTYAELPNYPILKISGFSDIDFSASDAKGSKSGFSEGQFDLQFASELSHKVDFLGELSLTARADAGEVAQLGMAAMPGFNAEVERAIVRYNLADYFKLSAGRYHTQLNYWNTAFHHGMWLQTTIGRPEMIKFGGEFLPVHFVGGLAEGTLGLGPIYAGYYAGLGNSRGNLISRAGDAGSNSNERALLGSVYIRPYAFRDFELGGAGFLDGVILHDGRRYDERIIAGHAVWTKEDPEVITEYANVRHKTINGDSTFNSNAYYVQLAYRLPWFSSQLKPYYRYEVMQIDRLDNVFANVPDYVGYIIGIRYDFSELAAIKAEYRNQHYAGVAVNVAYAQISYTF
ncbi:MAG: hypothetical protein ABI444_12565 [Candidatus Kapaibacterium sp.]